MKKVLAFEIADTTVTNREFKAFIDATGYTTTAETIGDSYVFHLFVEPEKRAEYGHVSGSPWWLLVPGACWNHPTGARVFDYGCDGPSSGARIFAGCTSLL